MRGKFNKGYFCLISSKLQEGLAFLQLTKRKDIYKLK